MASYIIKKYNLDSTATGYGFGLRTHGRWIQVFDGTTQVASYGARTPAECRNLNKKVVALAERLTA